MQELVAPARVVAFGWRDGWTAPSRGAAFRWGVALAAAAAVLLARVLLDPWLPREAAWLVAVPVVLTCAALGGTGPAVAVALAAGLAGFAAVEPPARLAAAGAPDPVALGLFAVACATGIGLLALARDWARRATRAEARAAGLAEQRRLVFAEMRHRVRTDLTAAGVVLGAAGEGVEDPAARGALADAAARLGAVARLSRLLDDPGGEDVDLGAVLASLAPDALAACGAEGRVGVDLEGGPVPVAAARAVPLALVAAELLSNAARHGFPSDAGGRIRVSLERTGSACARLIVRHDGEGLPPGFDLGRVETTGLTVARRLAQELGGELVVVQDRGVAACLTFPLADPSGA